MEWTDESITRLRGLWQEGLSTAEIGRRMQITKNAVVGKAHRLTLPPRPSPIRRVPELAGATLQPAIAQPVEAAVQRPRPVIAAIPAPIRPAPVPASPSPVATPDNVQLLRPVAPPAVAPAIPATVPIEAVPAQAVRPAPVMPDEAPEPVLRVVPSAPRRRGLTCCWPLGEPGTREFHFCGGDPVAGKPYCAQHAALAYVKLRDRRDSVA